MDDQTSAFIEDVLAGCNRGLVERVKSDSIAQGSLDLSRVLALPEVVHSIAFEAAWNAACSGLFGAPTRIELGAFLGLLIDEKVPPLEAAQRAVLALTPLRVLVPSQTELKAAMERTVQAFASSLSSTTLANVRASLWRRFVSIYGKDKGNDQVPAGNKALMDAHATLRRSSAYEYDGHPWRCPITGHELDRISEDQVPFMSPLERLRSPMIRNVYLWRRDAGGAITLAPKGEGPFQHQSIRQPICRVDDGYVRALLAALPPGLYSTVFVPRSLASSSIDVRNIVWLCRDDDEADVTVNALWIGRKPQLQNQQRWLPPPDHLYGAMKRAPFWAQALSRDMAKAVLRFRLSADANANATSIELDGRGVLNYHQLLARYAHVRALGRRVFITATPTGSCVGTVVAIDTRENVWTALGILATLDNLRCTSWRVAVFCADRNLEWMRRAIMPHAPHARIEALSELTALGDAFDIEAYNELMKSEAFWDRLPPDSDDDNHVVLTVQDDGAVLRTGLDEDADIMAQKYVGAPWLPHPILAAAGIDTKNSCVGNGGVSLRNVQAMRAILKASKANEGAARRTLFNGNAQPTPEDVFFAAGVLRVFGPSAQCPAEVARRFAFEQAFVSGCYAFHKPWAYLPPAVYLPEFQRILDEAASRA